MSNDTNPYAAPVAAVGPGPAAATSFVPGGRALPFGQGVEWIGRGWRRFTADPWVWIGITFMLFVIQLVLGFVPLVNFVGHLLMFPLAGGVYLGCRARDEGKPFEFNALFSAFGSNSAGQLFLLGLVLALVAWAGIILITLSTVGTGAFALFSSGGAGMFGGGGVAGWGAIIGTVFLWVVLLLVFVTVYSMASLFSTYLVAVQRVPLGEALSQSMQGCMRNMLPLTAFSLVAIGLVLVAIIPLGLGLIVVVPLLTASLYEAGRDIYTA